MKKDFTKNKNKKGALIALLGMLVLVILSFGGEISQMFTEKISYNNFLEMVSDGKVNAVDINTTTGEVKFEVKDKNGETKSCYTNYPYTEDFREMLLLNNIEIETHPSNWLVTIFKYLGTPVLLLLCMYMFLVPNTNSFAIEPVCDIKIRFNDIAGMDEIKDDLLLISEMMINKTYKEKGARIPRGILLQGPPGNGKTMLAKAFAGETGVNFIAINASDFGSQFVGIGASKIKKVFDAAKKHAPCVIFIDELDAVGAKRTSNSDSASKEMNTVLTALLNQMDGFTPMDDVMVLAATNRASDLDSALVRPGRFDRHFVINLPDKNERYQLFKLYTKDKSLHEDVDFDSLATRTFGYSCSKIECVINEAVINSVRNKHEKITLRDFEDAVLQMDIKGHVKKNYTRSEREKQLIAYHEAGHAVLGHFLTSEKISNISIMPTTSGAGGFTVTQYEDDNELCPLTNYKAKISMLYGGRAAETILCGGVENASTGASQDIREATNLACSYVTISSGIDLSAFGSTGEEEVSKLAKKLLKETWETALDTLKEKWSVVEAVATALLKRETLNADEFLNVVKEIEVNKR